MKAKLFAVLYYVLNRKLDISKYDDRLTIQKLTFILKSAGIDFGYNFSWYVKGPYSPLLASAAFAFFQNQQEIEYPSLFDEKNKIIDSIKNVFSEDIKNPDKLELIASILFIHEERQIPFFDDNLIKTVKSLKPWFEEQEIKDAIEKIVKCGLFD